MRYLAILVFSLFFFCSCASQGALDDRQTVTPTAAPEPEKQRLAVLDMEDTTGDIDEESLRQATNYLRILIVQSQRFIVVSDEEKKALIRELRKESHGAQYDESQRIPLGQRVAANVVLITTILKLQEDYILKAELIDLAKETIIAGASERFEPDTFQQAIEAVAQAVSGEREHPARPETDAALAGGMVPVTGSDADSAREDDGDAGGVNFLIINIVSAREGREPDPAYRHAAEKRHAPDGDSHPASTGASAGQEPKDSFNTVSPLPTKKIFFRNPVKPIRFRIDETTPHRISVPSSSKPPSPAVTRVPPTSPSPSPVLSTTPRTSESTPVSIEPKKSERPHVKPPATGIEKRSFQRQEPVHTSDHSEQTPPPRPVLSPSKKTSPAPVVLPSPEKRQKKEEEKEDSDKKEEKKKKPSSGTIFVPRQ